MSDHGMTMYALRPIVTLPTICPCSKTMYEMRNIHEDKHDGRRRHHDADTDAKMPDDVITEQVIRLLQKPSSEYNALEIRQEKILNQLAELKKQVSTLCHFLKQSNKTVQKDCVSKKAININLLIKVDPNQTPYLLYALQKLWKDTDFRIKTYRHSTVKQEIPACFPTRIVSTTKNVVNITIIWKKVPLLEVFTDLQSEPLIGESNLLRYLYRMIDTYENDSTRMYLMDNVLDMCYVAYCQHRTDILRVLSDTLDEWSDRDKPNIADVGVWSMLNKYFIVLLPDPLKELKIYYDTIFRDKDSESLFEDCD